MAAAEDGELRCAMASLKPLADALACIGVPSRAHDVQLSHSDGGLRFSTGAPSHHASVVLPPAAFTRLHVAHRDVRVRLNLSALQDALAVLSAVATAAAAPVELWFAPPTLVARAELDGCVVRVALAALDAASPLPPALPADAPDVAAFILAADAFRDALSDLHYAAASLVQLDFDARQPCVRLTAPPHAARQLPRVSVELTPSTARFQALHCPRSQSVHLAHDHLLRAARALLAADTVKLALNSAGVLTIVCKLRAASADHSTFVHFVLLTQQPHSNHHQSPSTPHASQ